MSGEKIPSDELVPTRVVARYFDVQPATVHQWRRLGRIPSAQVTPGRILYDLEEVKRALAAPDAGIGYVDKHPKTGDQP